ncbi:hypothetical protein [Bacillus cytotoxicus]|nr:hypothetical protein [Bacillus cytotoxicus]
MEDYGHRSHIHMVNKDDFILQKWRMNVHEGGFLAGGKEGA